LKREHEKQNITAYKPKHFPKPSVVNSSTWNVTDEQKEVLKKGLKLPIKESFQM